MLESDQNLSTESPAYKATPAGGPGSVRIPIKESSAVSDSTQSLPYRDSRCGALWGGSKTSHCSRCHETFSTPGNFDKHQRENYCLAPASVGLVEVPRVGYMVWAAPADPNRWSGADIDPFGGDAA